MLCVVPNHRAMVCYGINPRVKHPVMLCAVIIQSVRQIVIMCDVINPRVKHPVMLCAVIIHSVRQIVILCDGINHSVKQPCSRLPW